MASVFAHTNRYVLMEIYDENLDLVGCGGWIFNGCSTVGVYTASSTLARIGRIGAAAAILNFAARVRLCTL